MSAYNEKTCVVNSSELETELSAGWQIDGNVPYTATSPNGSKVIIETDGSVTVSDTTNQNNNGGNENPGDEPEEPQQC